MDKGYALITGASSGIGYELAKVFAQHQYSLILVARSQNKLRELADDLKSQHEVSVHIIEKDLSLPHAAKEIYDEVQDHSLEVNVLVNNAGIGYVGWFHEASGEANKDVTQVNIAALTELTRLFAKDMVKARSGKILNVASTGAFHPGPYIAVYYATKAYVLSFSEAIANELSPYNITVTAVCPGATRTNFARRAGKRDVKWAMDAKKVAAISFQALMKGKKVVVPGWMNKILIALPRSFVSKKVGEQQRRLSVHKPE